jgi:hypothetical protein
MNKLKLVQIIVKDLDELKILTQEIAESENDSPIFVDLALSRANLICQEIKLLRKFSENADSPAESDDDMEDEVSDLHFPDPELEILNLEDQPVAPVEEETLPEAIDEEANGESETDIPVINYPEPEFEISEPEEQLQEGADDIAEEEDDVVYDSDLDEEDDEDFDDEVAFEEEEEEEEGPIAPKKNQSDDLIELDDEAIVKDSEPENNEETENEKVHEITTHQTTAQFSELKTEMASGIREIHMEDLDDEENDPMQFSPVENRTTRPVMREIPKPEIPKPEILEAEGAAPEKLVVGETFQKERSLNDAMGENKSTESSLGNGPIASLRAAIGLNDRFLFIREIFANNTDKYNTIIDQLDKLETIQQAVEYLKANLTLEKNQTSLKFVELLKRRFSK